MIPVLQLVLLIAALILFVIGAAGGIQSRINPVAAGLACWVAAELLGHLPPH